MHLTGFHPTVKHLLKENEKELREGNNWWWRLFSRYEAE
jgi:hypothetical protein